MGERGSGTRGCKWPGSRWSRLGLRSRRKSRSCLGGSGEFGKVRSGRELGGSTRLRTAVPRMPLRASQGGKWGLFHDCWRSCVGEAGTRKALAGRGGGSTGRYRWVLFLLLGYTPFNKGSVRLRIPPTSVLVALRGNPAKFGFWISEFRGSLVTGGAGKRAPRLGRRREPNSNFVVNSLSPAAQNCLGSAPSVAPERD